MSHRVSFRRRSGHPALGLLTAGILAWTGQAVATEADEAGSRWTFGGYGTLAYQHDSATHLDFRRDLGQAVDDSAAGHWVIDSRASLQASYRFSARTEATVQAVIRHKPEATFKNVVEWAFVSHELVPNLQLRAGRVGLDFFLLSDYRNVGYLQTAVRPNVDFYGFLPVYAVDGGDLSWSFAQGSARWKLKTQVGQGAADFPVFGGGNYGFRVHRLFDVSVVREAGPWRAKAAFVATDIKTDLPTNPLVDPLGAIAANPFVGPAIQADAANYLREFSIRGTHVTYSSLGAAYDDGTWQLQAEGSRMTGERRVVAQGTAWYVQAGRRFGALMPFVVLSAYQPKYGPATIAAAWPFPGGAQLQGGAVTVLNTSRIDQHTTGVGIRWDVLPNAAVKAQWDATTIADNGYGLWWQTPGTHIDGRRVRVATLAVDWVF